MPAISQGYQTAPQPFIGHQPTAEYRGVEQSALQIWQPRLSSSDPLLAEDVIKITSPTLSTPAHIPEYIYSPLLTEQPSIAAVTKYDATTTAETLSVNVHRRKSSSEPLHKRPKVNFDTTNTQYSGKQLNIL